MLVKFEPFKKNESPKGYFRRDFTFNFLDSTKDYRTNLLFLVVSFGRGTSSWLIVLYGETNFPLSFGFGGTNSSRAWHLNAFFPSFLGEALILGLLQGSTWVSLFLDSQEGAFGLDRNNTKKMFLVTNALDQDMSPMNRTVPWWYPNCQSTL